MTNDDCDVLVIVAAAPGRRMVVADLKKAKCDYRLIPRLVSDKHLVYFDGGWVALTDGGYDAMILHCAHNF